MKKIFFFLFAFSVVCCNSPEKNDLTAFETIDDRVIVLKKEVYSHLDSVISLIKEEQESFSDSIYRNYWEIYKGEFYYINYQDDKAMLSCRKVEKFCRENQTMKNISIVEAQCSNLIGILMQTVNERDSALYYFKNAYNAISKTSYRREMSNYCINIADVYRQTGKHPQAIQWLGRALEVADSLNLKSQSFAIKSGMGQIYGDLHNFPLSEKYFSSLDSLYPSDNPYDNYFFQNSRGNVYFFAEKYPEALECFKKAYSIVKTFNNRAFEAVVETNLGEVYLSMDRLDSAKYYIDKSYSFYYDNPYSDDGILFYVTGLKAAYALKTGDVKDASYYLSKPFDRRKITPQYLFIYDKRMSDYYAQKGNYKKAFEYKISAEQYDDSLRNILRINNISEIEYRYSRDTSLLNKKLIIVEKENTIAKQNVTIIFISSALVILIAASLVVYGAVKKRKKDEKRRQIALISKLRMDSARNRISPHFIFNVLNSIIPSLRNEEEAGLPLDLLVKTLRNNLMISGRVAIPLEEEIEMVKNYSCLIATINKNAPKVLYNISSSVKKSSLIPSASIQINVENAIKHAFPEGFECKGAKEITVSIFENDVKSYKIEIKDNGIGYDHRLSGYSDNKENSTGNGIKILMQIFAVLNSFNSETIVFDITSDNGTLISITIPYKYNYNI